MKTNFKHINANDTTSTINNSWTATSGHSCDTTFASNKSIQQLKENCYG